MSEPSRKAHLVLIGGGTCSGKTTIAKAIGRRIAKLKTVIISHDNYYRDLAHLDLSERAEVNFDHPDSIDREYLVQDLKKMMAGEAVNVPDYDFSTHSRNEGKLCIAGADVIILEGIFALFIRTCWSYPISRYIWIQIRTSAWHDVCSGTSWNADATLKAC